MSLCLINIVTKVTYNAVTLIAAVNKLAIPQRPIHLCKNTSLFSHLKVNQNNSTCQFSSVQLLSHVRLFATPWITAHQASLSITNSWSSLKLMSMELVMPYSHLILCRPLLLLPPIPPSIRDFSFFLYKQQLYFSASPELASRLFKNLFLIEG